MSKQSKGVHWRTKAVGTSSVCGPLSASLVEPFLHAIVFAATTLCLVLFGTTRGLFPWDYGRWLFSHLESNPPNRLTSLAASALLTLIWVLLLNRLINGGLVKGTLKTPRDLTNKVAIVTGANSGIGKQVTIILLRLGATVVIGCRNPSKAKAAMIDILHAAGLPQDSPLLRLLPLDLANVQTVRQFVCQFIAMALPLDFLINNAGLATVYPEKLASGLEKQFATNYVGPFLLTTLLFDMIKTSNGRVINVSSLAHILAGRVLNRLSVEDFFDHDRLVQFESIHLYGFSKACNIWFTHELQRRFDLDASTTATTYAVHPGVVKTNLGNDNASLAFQAMMFVIGHFSKPAEVGAQTVAFMAIEETSRLSRGSYYADMRVAPVGTVCDSQNTDFEKELWDRTVASLDVPTD